MFAACLCAVLLAGEPLKFDAARAIRYTDKQLRATAPATRAGLDRWSRTKQGRALLRYFDRRDYEILVTEDEHEDGSGRAPQPGIATLTAGSNSLKTYQLIINPSPNDAPTTTIEGFPSKTEHFVAATWAAEMLHIYFYSKGIVLPHHGRDDFQEAWLTVATELGFPVLRHGDDEPRIAVGRERFVVVGE